jgi:hypothetical protein
MKLRLKILAMAVITASTYSLTSCSAPAGYSYQNVSIALTSFCSDCAQSGILVFYNPAYPQPPNPGSVVEMTPGGVQGGTNTFVATVTNAPQTNVTWTVYPTPNLSGITQLPTGTALPITESGNPVGTIEAASGNTVYYNAPSGVPVYSGAALEQANAMQIPQGFVLLVASVSSDPSNPSQVATANQLIQVYNPSPGTPSTYLTPSSSAASPAGQTQPVLTVPRNTSYAFYGGVVGAYPCTSVTACGSAPIYTTDNTAIWEVGPAPFSLTTAIPGGNSVYGTITSQGVYTAPATIPTTTNSSTTINGEVVIYLISHLSPAKNNYAYTAIN